MDPFERLNAIRSTLFQTVNACVNNGAFLNVERSALNELLADPLAGDHLLLLEGGVRRLDTARIDEVIDLLEAANTGLQTVLGGANSRAERRDAIDHLDSACSAYTTLLDDAATA